MTFNKASIVEHLHRLLDEQMMTNLIGSLRQPQTGNTSQVQSLSGQSLDDEILRLSEQIGLSHKARGSISKMADHKKQTLLQQYRAQKAQLDALSGELDTDIRVRHNSFILPDNKEKQLQGWLHKKGGKLSSGWKKRWFVLFRNNSVAYYESLEHSLDESRQPLGTIVLYEVTRLERKAREDAKVGKKWKFELVSKARTFVLKAEEEKAYNQWIRRVLVRITPNVIREGWAHKLSGSRKNWRRRYLTLVNYETRTELRYYEDKARQSFKVKFFQNVIVHLFGNQLAIELKFFTF